MPYAPLPSLTPRSYLRVRWRSTSSDIYELGLVAGLATSDLTPHAASCCASPRFHGATRGALARRQWTEPPLKKSRRVLLGGTRADVWQKPTSCSRAPSSSTTRRRRRRRRRTPSRSRASRWRRCSPPSSTRGTPTCSSSTSARSARSSCRRPTRPSATRVNRRSRRQAALVEGAGAGAVRRGRRRGAPRRRRRRGGAAERERRPPARERQRRRRRRRRRRAAGESVRKQTSSAAPTANRLQQIVGARREPFAGAGSPSGRSPPPRPPAWTCSSWVVLGSLRIAA